MSRSNFQAPDLCAACKGFCCNKAPGITVPEDWVDPVDRAVLLERLAIALGTGKWCVDWWEGDPRAEFALPDVMEVSFEVYTEALNRPGRLGCAYYVRPAIQGHEGKVRHPAWIYGNSPCALLTPTGCALGPHERPIECRTLKPGPKFPDDCDHPPGSYPGKQAVAIRWIPYHDVILEALRRAGDDAQ